MRRGWLSASVWAVAAWVGTACAGERPPTTPQRDVDVTYQMAQPDGTAVPLRQRIRWTVAAGLMRVDPPTPGFYMIVDSATKRMSIVKAAERSVLDVTSNQFVSSPGAGAYVAGDTDRVAGLACRNWQTTDAGGQEATLCLTADGVMLRASHGGRALLEASSISYGPQDPAAFQVPQGYRHVSGSRP